MIKSYYQDNNCTIYHGDCLEILSHLSKVDLVLTDPPYGINTKSDGTGKLNPWADLCNASLWYELWIKMCRDKLKSNGAIWSFLNWRSIVTFQKAACALSWPIENILVWDKECIGPGGPKGLRPSYEMCALWVMPEFNISDRGIPDIKRSKWASLKPHGHPAEKPIDLITWLINISNRNNILDPFMGSGTILRAAKNLQRKAIGIEIDEKYCEIAAKRLAQEVLLL